jgi:hypothetical protein
MTTLIHYAVVFLPVNMGWTLTVLTCPDRQASRSERKCWVWTGAVSGSPPTVLGCAGVPLSGMLLKQLDCMKLSWSTALVEGFS